MGKSRTGGPKWLEWAELPPRKDVYSYYGTTKWGNHDLYPIPMKERQFNTGLLCILDYYWCVCRYLHPGKCVYCSWFDSW